MIYVDPLFHFPARNARVLRVGAKHGHLWCHLWCDKDEEQQLHDFAAKLGMLRTWFQDKTEFPHYDLVPPRRDLAIKLGAVQMPLAEWLRKQKGGV